MSACAKTESLAMRESRIRTCNLTKDRPIRSASSLREKSETDATRTIDNKRPQMVTIIDMTDTAHIR